MNHENNLCIHIIRMALIACGNSNIGQWLAQTTHLSFCTMKTGNNRQSNTFVEGNFKMQRCLFLTPRHQFQDWSSCCIDLKEQSSTPKNSNVVVVNSHIYWRKDRWRFLTGKSFLELHSNREVQNCRLEKNGKTDTNLNDLRCAVCVVGGSLYVFRVLNKYQ